MDGINSLASVRVSGMRLGCIMSSWLFNIYMDAVMKLVKDRDGKEGREWRLPRPLYADDLVLCGEWKDDQRAIVGRFFESQCR